MNVQNDWPKTDKQLGEFLGISSSTVRGYSWRYKKDLTQGIHYDLSYHESNSRNKYLWLKEGAIFIAHNCRSSKASEFLESEGVAKKAKSHIESDTIRIIICSLEGILKEFKPQHHVGGYKIDLYLPEVNIAIECDERGHKHHQQWKDEFREFVIKNKLGCEFIRYNPDEPGFNIGRVVNVLFKKILKINENAL